jgi:hypothetical protein
MLEVKRDFEARVVEINLYFSLLEDILINDAKLVLSDDTIKTFDSILSETMKANGFLLLYNLAESCTSGAIENIYTSIKRDDITYDQLRKELKIEIIKSLKENVGASPFVEMTSLIANDIVFNCFDRNKLFSGNVDARELKKIALKYGFSSSITAYQDSEGNMSSINTGHILTVKNKRNDLAHGIYSFKDCGREYTIQDLTSIKTHVVEYLRQVLDNIEEYINNKEYLLVA